MESKMQSASGEALYKELLRELLNIYTDAVQIEVLPSFVEVPEGQIFLRDGESLGIPKKVLAGAFIRAKSIFMSHFKDASSNVRVRLQVYLTKTKRLKEALDATLVMLLFDPEFLTACNFRKRYLLGLEPDHDKFMKRVELEKNFITAILMSPLHRQSKSPTLWYHRYWLNKVVGQHLARTGNDFWTLSSTTDDLRSIQVSAENHPNNYYAWQHGRRMIELYSQLANNGKQTEILTAPEQVVQDTLRWCLKHPSDTAGWSFLLFLINKTKQNGSTLFETVLQVMKFTQQTRWEKVALWHFVRTLYISTACGDAGVKDNILYMISHVQKTGGLIPLDGKILEPGEAKDKWDLFMSQ